MTFLTTGRWYYKCTRDINDGGCGFFQWDDDSSYDPAGDTKPYRVPTAVVQPQPLPTAVLEPQQSRPAVVVNPGPSVSAPPLDLSSLPTPRPGLRIPSPLAELLRNERFRPKKPIVVVLCNCKKPAVKCAVANDGPDNGRLFYTCGVPSIMDGENGQRCCFFKWVDEVVGVGQLRKMNSASPDGGPDRRPGGNSKPTTG